MCPGSLGRNLWCEFQDASTGTFKVTLCIQLSFVFAVSGVWHVIRFISVEVDGVFSWVANFVGSENDENLDSWQRTCLIFQNMNRCDCVACISWCFCHGFVWFSRFDALWGMKWSTKMLRQQQLGVCDSTKSKEVVKQPWYKDPHWRRIRSSWSIDAIEDLQKAIVILRRALIYRFSILPNRFDWSIFIIFDIM
jgi:hypothetical protein